MDRDVNNIGTIPLCSKIWTGEKSHQYALRIDIIEREVRVLSSDNRCSVNDGNVAWATEGVESAREEPREGKEVLGRVGFFIHVSNCHLQRLHT